MAVELLLFIYFFLNCSTFEGTFNRLRNYTYKLLLKTQQYLITLNLTTNRYIR